MKLVNMAVFAGDPQRRPTVFEFPLSIPEPQKQILLERWEKLKTKKRGKITNDDVKHLAKKHSYKSGKWLFNCPRQEEKYNIFVWKQAVLSDQRFAPLEAEYQFDRKPGIFEKIPDLNLHIPVTSGNQRLVEYARRLQLVSLWLISFTDIQPIFLNRHSCTYPLRSVLRDKTRCSRNVLLVQYQEESVRFCKTRKINDFVTV